MRFIKRIRHEDLSPGQFYFYNFDRTPYISTIEKEYYESDLGLKILDLIEYFEPDFYTELHCYNLKNYEKLTSMERYERTGIPPLIKLGNHVLVSSVSPLIRMSYFSTSTVCKTLEIPCIEKLNPEVVENYGFDKDLAIETYEKLLRLILKSPSRKHFETEMMNLSVNIPLEKALDLGWKILADCFEPAEVGIKTDLIEQYWPKEA